MDAQPADGVGGKGGRAVTPQNGTPRHRNAGGDTLSSELSKPNDDSLARFNPHEQVHLAGMVAVLTVARDLSAAERLAAVHLLTAFTNRQTGLAFPSQSTLARAFGVHRTTVTAWLQSLREKKYLHGERVRQGGKFARLEYHWLWRPEYADIERRHGETRHGEPPAMSAKSDKSHHVGETRHGQPPTMSAKTMSAKSDTTSLKSYLSENAVQKESLSSNNNNSSAQAHARKPKPRVKREHRKLMDSKLAQSTLEALRKIKRFRAATVSKSDGTPAAWVHELEPLADRMECAGTARNLQIVVAELDCPSNETPVIAVRNAVREELDFQQRFVEQEPELLKRIKRAAQDGDRQSLVTLAQSEFRSVKRAAVEALEALETERLEREKREKRRLANEQQRL